MGFFRKLFSSKNPSKSEEAKALESNIKYECLQKSENVNSDYATARAIQRAEHGIKLSKNPEDYPRWFSYECGIKDPFLKYSQLINEHYLEMGSFEQAISNKKVSELKEILLAQNLPAKGKKCDLINTICDYADRSKIDIEFVYFISEKGKKYIEEHDELLSAGELKKYMISIDEYYEKKSQLPTYFNMNDIVWNIFNERNLMYSSDNNFGYLRNNQLYMAQFCQAENRLIESLKFYLYTLYYDMCQNLKHDEGDTLAPGIVEKIFELKEYYIEKMIDNCNLLYVPSNYHRPQKSIFYQLVNDIFNGLNINELKNKYKMYENYCDLALAQIEEQKVSVNSLGERLDKLDENGELPWGWWTYYHPELEKYESEIAQLALATRTPKPVDDDILAYRKLIDRYYEYKEYCYSNGECYKKYFSDYYEHCHNSVSEDFCYITSFENELEDILNHYSEKVSEYNDFLDCQKFINTKSMEIFNVIKSMPGILQKDLKKQYDKKYNSAVDTILYQLSKQGKIVKEKYGNSNKLFIK